MTFTFRTLMLTAALASTLAQAQGLLDTKQSSIVASFKQMGVPLDGKFQKYTADLQFDPARPDQARVRLDVDVASFDIGDESYNKEVRSKVWFNASAYPAARFESASIRPDGAGRFLVSGKLSVKGLSSTVSFPVTYRRDGKQETFDGSLPIKRLQFNIGDQEWRDTSMVADEVQLKFHIVTSAR